MSASPMGFRISLVFDILLQGHGIIVLRVVRAVEQSYGAVPRGVANRRPSVRCPAKLRKVPAAEFLPFSGFVAEPLPQLGAWSGIFQPAVDSQRGLFHAAGPKPFNEIAYPVIGVLLLINSFQLDHYAIPPKVRVARAALG